MREYCSVDHQLVQGFERFVGLDGHHVRTRGHDFAHHLVAELDDGLNQFAVVFLNQPFFGAGRNQGFDIFGGSGGLIALRLPAL